MALKVGWASPFKLNLKIIYLSGIVTVLVVCIDGSTQMTEMKVSVEADPMSDAANINEKQNSKNGNVIKRQTTLFEISSKYSQSSIKSADHEVNSSSILKSQPLDKYIVTRDQNIKGNRKQTAATRSFNIWSILHSSLLKVFRNCSSATGTYESEKGLVKCLKQEAIREFKSILYTRSRGYFELRNDDNYRTGRKGNYTDVDQRSRKISLRMKVMPGLFVWMSQREDGLKVGMELDETDIRQPEGRGKDRKKLKKLNKFLSLLLIPVALQFLLLPMVLGTLKMMATKALMAGKLALLLVLFNAAWVSLVPQNVEHNTRVASEHYGYDGAVEYGAYLGRSKRNLAHRGRT